MNHLKNKIIAQILRSAPALLRSYSRPLRGPEAAFQTHYLVQTKQIVKLTEVGYFGLVYCGCAMWTPYYFRVYNIHHGFPHLSLVTETLHHPGSTSFPRGQSQGCCWCHLQVCFLYSYCFGWWNVITRSLFPKENNNWELLYIFRLYVIIWRSLKEIKALIKLCQETFF